MAQPHPASSSQAIGTVTASPLSGASQQPPSLEEAYAYCSAQARRHYENFPVGSWLLPRHLRPAVHAVYAFARHADDLADEPEHEGSRLQALDSWQRHLERAWSGDASHPTFVALADTLQRYRLPLQPFRDLLTAFRMDARRTRYDSWEQVLGYCRYSANPVGRIMLRLFGHEDADCDRFSDYLCTSLQLTNFWQDLSVDLPRGRCYLPCRDLEREDLAEGDLQSPGTAPARRRILTVVTDRTHDLYDEARPLPARVGGRLSWELRAILAGGERVLEKVVSGTQDPFRSRPRLGWEDALPLLGAMFVRRRRQTA
jgi:phytoene synthase